MLLSLNYNIYDLSLLDIINHTVFSLKLKICPKLYEIMQKIIIYLSKMI